MSPGRTTLADVLAAVVAAGADDEPVTADDVAAELDCASETARDRLDELRERGDLRAKRVGEATRVWWRPTDDVRTPGRRPGTDDREGARSADPTDGPEDGFFTLDDEFRLTHVNDRVTDVLGVSESEALGSDVRDAGFATDAAADAVRRAMADGTQVSFEEYCRSVEGWVEVTLYPTPAGLAGCVRDVTPRREHRRELERTRERFRKVFEASQDAIFINDPAADEIIDANPAGCELLGFDREELLSRGPSDFHPDEMDRFREFVDEVFEEGSGWTDELTCLHRDGHRIPVEMSASMLELDGRKQLVAIVRDVTERRAYEERLRRNRRQLQALFDILPVAVFVAEADGRIVEWNEAAVDIWGGEVAECGCVDEYVQYEGRWVETGEPVEAGEWALARALRGEEVTDPDVVEIERFDGETRTVLNYAMPIRDDGGEVARAVEVQVDVTERQAQKRRLREQNERLESFASMLAHELRNPVTIGQIYSRQLPDGADDEAVAYVTEAFDRIEDIIDVMLGLTQDRDAVVEETTVDLAAVARDAWADVDAPEASLRVESDATIRADETYLHHLFRNLFENAVEHGGSDVTVTVGRLPGRSTGRSRAAEDVGSAFPGEPSEPREGIRREAERTGDGFYVADDGRGIDDDVRGNVFDPGFSSAASDGGMGLGLTFVRELARGYGWTCSVSESEGGGARFEFGDVDCASSDE